MKRFNINGQSVLLFEDQLWISVNPEPSSDQEAAKRLLTAMKEIDDKPKKRGRRKGWKSGMPPRKSKQEFEEQPLSTKRLEPDDFKHLKEMIKADYPVLEIARKFNFSTPYIYQIKSKMRKEGEL